MCFTVKGTYFVSSEHPPQTDENDLSFEINVHFVKFGKIFRSSEVRVNDLSLNLPARGVLQDGGQDVGAVQRLPVNIENSPSKVKFRIPSYLVKYIPFRNYFRKSQRNFPRSFNFPEIRRNVIERHCVTSAVNIYGKLMQV